MNSSILHEPRHHAIVAHCESYLAAHGDTHKGVGWPNYDDAQVRYRVMLDGMLAATPAGQPWEARLSAYAPAPSPA